MFINLAIPLIEERKALAIIQNPNSVIQRSTLIKGLVIFALDIDEDIVTLLTLTYGRECVWNR